MKKIFLFFFLVISIYSESEVRKWGQEEGQLDWKTANNICKANNMRLPTKKELLSLYKSPQRKSWTGNWYWTGDELDKEKAWTVVLNVGDIIHIPKQYHNHVRCISVSQ